MTFRVGQKVVCIDDQPDYNKRTFPVKIGTVLTISKIGFCTFPECVGFEFMEVCSPYKGTLFCHCRFRPVVDRKTDISIFTKMLNTNKDLVE